MALILVGLLLCAPVSAEKVQGLPIVDQAIEHHGGELFTNSELRLVTKSRSGGFSIEATLEGDLFDYRIRDLEDDLEHRWNNASLRVFENGEEQVLDEGSRGSAQSYVNQRTYFLFLPYKLNDPSVYHEDLGLEDWSGTSLHRVKVSFEPGTSRGASDEYTYWFDPESGRLVQFAYNYSQGNGLRFRKLFNYRRVGGLLFYDAENYGLNVRSNSLSVDDITPESAAELPLVSTILTEEVEVDRPSRPSG